MRLRAGILCGLTFAIAGHQLHANEQDQKPTPQEQSSSQPSESTMPEIPPAHSEQGTWFDKTREGVYEALWHSVMQVDQWFGSTEDPSEYQRVYGSIAPAILWDRHKGVQEPIRFNLNLPLPHLDRRFNAFVGRFNPNELISESEEPSGTFPRQYGPTTEDRTVIGVAFHEPPKQRGYFESGAGIRVTLPLDPYVKGSYVYERGASERGSFSLRETAFWQHSKGLGVTTRADIERIYELYWLTRWSGSATFSEKSVGVLWWSTVDVMRDFPPRRAVVMQLEVNGQTDAPVPLQDYGAQLAYRRSVLRNWLIVELRSGISWPKDLPQQDRRLSPGVGIGFELLFGTDEFPARPSTF